MLRKDMNNIEKRMPYLETTLNKENSIYFDNIFYF